MKRTGFTMIELIFVIVILGILAAVAVPRLTQTQDIARNTNAEAFVGSLNRTAGADMWALAITDGSGGSLDNGNGGTTFNLSTYIELPQGYTAQADLSNCANPILAATPAVVTIADTAVSGGANVYCRDGNLTHPAKFGFVRLAATNDVNVTLP